MMCHVSAAVQKEADGKIDTEMAIVLTSIATACKQIGSLVSRSGIAGMTGLAGAANIQVCHGLRSHTSCTLARHRTCLMNGNLGIQDAFLTSVWARIVPKLVGMCDLPTQPRSLPVARPARPRPRALS